MQVLDMVYESEIRENDRAKLNAKEKKDIFNDNKEILKKNFPKTLLFLIKNTPKDCYMIKDEVIHSEENIGLSDKVVFVEGEEKAQLCANRSSDKFENSEERSNQ